MKKVLIFICLLCAAWTYAQQDLENAEQKPTLVIALNPDSDAPDKIQNEFVNDFETALTSSDMYDNVIQSRKVNISDKELEDYNADFYILVSISGKPDNYYIICVVASTGTNEVISTTTTSNISDVASAADDIANSVSKEIAKYSSKKSQKKGAAHVSPQNSDYSQADNSKNSMDIAPSVAELIKNTIQSQDPKKYDTYSTDLVRFDKLRNTDDISKYINSVTSPVSYIAQENETEAVIYVEKIRTQDMPLLLFLDGKCIGVGTRNKGLLTKLSKDEFRGVHSIEWRYILKGKSAALTAVLVNFSFKSNYVFSWNKNVLVQKN